MQFTTRFFAISATVAQVLAQPQLTNSGYSVTEGQPFTITWTNADGPVTLLLKDGASNDLSTVATIASGLTGTSFTWTPSGLPSDEYAIEIQDSTGNNYSPQFPYAGTGTVASSTPASSSAAPTSTKSSSSSLSSLSTVVTLTSTGSSSAPTSSSASNSSTTASSSSNSTTTASSTLSKATSKSTATATSSSSTSTNTPVNTNDSKKLGSSLAFVVLTAAALLVFQ